MRCVDLRSSLSASRICIVDREGIYQRSFAIRDNTQILKCVFIYACIHIYYNMYACKYNAFIFVCMYIHTHIQCIQRQCIHLCVYVHTHTHHIKCTQTQYINIFVCIHTRQFHPNEVKQHIEKVTDLWDLKNNVFLIRYSNIWFYSDLINCDILYFF